MGGVGCGQEHATTLASNEVQLCVVPGSALRPCRHLREASRKAAEIVEGLLGLPSGHEGGAAGTIGITENNTGLTEGGKDQIEGSKRISKSDCGAVQDQSDISFASSRAPEYHGGASGSGGVGVTTHNAARPPLSPSGPSTTAASFLTASFATDRRMAHGETQPSACNGVSSGARRGLLSRMSQASGATGRDTSKFASVSSGASAVGGSAHASPLATGWEFMTDANSHGAYKRSNGRTTDSPRAQMIAQVEYRCRCASAKGCVDARVLCV